MTNILPFAKKSNAPVFSIDEEALSAVLYLKRLKRSGETVHQTTEFGLVDQVMTHLLVTAGIEFDLIVNERLSDRQSIRSITVDRYGLEVQNKSQGLDASSALQHWPVEALVQYILDHEVPVDPRDIPGFEEIRLAG